MRHSEQFMKAQATQGFFDRMDDLYSRLMSVHSVLVCIQAVEIDNASRITLQEIPFAVGAMDKELHNIASDLDDLCREGRANVKDYIREKKEA